MSTCFAITSFISSSESMISKSIWQTYKAVRTTQGMQPEWKKGAKTYHGTIVQVESKGTHSQKKRKRKIKIVCNKLIRAKTCVSPLHNIRAWFGYWVVRHTSTYPWMASHSYNHQRNVAQEPKMDRAKKRYRRRKIVAFLLGYDCYCLHFAKRRCFFLRWISHFNGVVYYIFNRWNSELANRCSMLETKCRLTGKAKTVHRLQ